MLCESRLWIMACCDLEDVASAPPERAPQSCAWQGTQRAAAAAAAAAATTTACLVPASTRRASPAARGDSPETKAAAAAAAARGQDRSFPPDPTASRNQNRNPFDGGGGPGGGRISPGVEIPHQEGSVSDGPFLVPASCQLICQHYSDLCIRGDQVLPLSSDGAGDHPLCAGAKAAGPFLQSCDVLQVDSLPEQSSHAGQVLLPRRAGSHRWRQGSGRDLSVLFHGREGPFTNSLLNCYLEHKLLDLYQQYMLDNMAREQAGASGFRPPCPLLASEVILTSLDQLTQQLSRERRLEAGLAKDMVISCFLRVASDMQSGEISTPMLQFSEDPPPGLQGAPGGEEELDAPAQLAGDLD